jgi:hypothetical protein
VPDYVDKGEQRFEFETIDYSEFGMLMRAIADHPTTLFETGEEIAGHIGAQDASLVGFRGTVVRVQDRAEGRCYAVRIEVLGEAPE